MKKEKIIELINNNKRANSFLKAKLGYLERNKDINKKEIKEIKNKISTNKFHITKLEQMLKD